jgi:primosomal protein N' (replication factor Y)
VRVRTDVAALAKHYDYVVPAAWTHEVTVGTRVRMPLHGRSVTGWVVEVDAPPPPGVELLPLKSWLGIGPPPALIELAEWAAWRWAGPASFFLRVASPAAIVRSLPQSPKLAPPVSASDRSGGGHPLDGLLTPGTPLHAPAAPGLADWPAVVRLPPTTDLLDLVLAVVDHPDTRARTGSVLVLVPSAGWADRLATRLARRGYPATADWVQARAGWPIVVGSRAAAWAPVPQLAAAVVLDAHDEAYRQEGAPTYSAVDVVVERARREGSPCVLTSPVPPPTLSFGRPVLTTSTPAERSGWAAVEVIDQRQSDPRLGLFSEPFVRLARAVLDRQEAATEAHPAPLVCVYDRTGGARLLACARCGELARCAACGAATAKVGEKGAERFRCPRCGIEQPCVCRACGRLKFKTLRAGVAHRRQELAALLSVEVGEVTGTALQPSDPVPETPVLLGTKAVLYRVRHAAAVAFLDMDLHLLAPRLGATEESLDLLVRAARLVGSRGGEPTSRIQLQTRVPEHPVVAAAAAGDPSVVLSDEEAARRASGLPPFAALASVSGPLAPEYLTALRRAALGLEISVLEFPDDLQVVRAPSHDALCDLLASVPRPPGRGLRIEVDPSSI